MAWTLKTAKVQCSAVLDWFALELHSSLSLSNFLSWWPIFFTYLYYKMIIFTWFRRCFISEYWKNEFSLNLWLFWQFFPKSKNPKLHCKNEVQCSTAQVQCSAVQCWPPFALLPTMVFSMERFFTMSTFMRSYMFMNSSDMSIKSLFVNEFLTTTPSRAD